MIFTSYENILNEKDILIKRLELINEYNLKLNEESLLLEEFIKKIDNNILEIEKDLKDLNGIENKLYCEIVVKGTNVTRAIDKIAFEYNKDVSTLWKNYYPKIKKRINLIKKI